MQNRRQFVQTLIRGGIFSSLTLLSGALIFRWGGAADCHQNYISGNCDFSNQCNLPEADKHRLDKARLPKTNAEDGRTRK